MRFCTTQSALRFVAITLFSILLASCGQGDGPTEVNDPLFATESVSLSLPVKNGFEDPAAVSITDFGGGTTAIIDNPVKSAGARGQARPATRPNTSSKVGQMIKFTGETFGGSTITLPETLDFTDSEVLTMLVWASRPVDVTLQLEGSTNAGDRVRVARYFGSGAWEELVFDFSGMSPPATNQITLIFANGTMGDAAGNPSQWTFYFDDLAGGSGGGSTGGGGGNGLPFSDGFESGDLAGWTATANGGTITADNTQAGGGTYSARLVAGPSQAPALSFEGLAAGSVNPGDTIDISWDMCGSFAGAGEVLFPALLSEPGGSAGAIRVFDTITSVPAVWTRYTRRFTADSTPGNVDAGVSVQFDVVCGGDGGCAADVFLDNVNVTNGGGDPVGAASGLSCAGGGGGGGGGGGAADVPVPFSTVVYDESYADIWGTFVCCGGAAVTEEVAADTTHGNVVQIDYTGGGTIAGLQYGAAELLDVSKYATGGGTLEFDALVTRAGNGDWKMKIEGATGADFVEVPLSSSAEGLAPVEGVWQHYTFNIENDLSGGGVTWDRLNLIMFFSDFGSGLGAIQLDNLVFKEAGLVISENGFDDIWEGLVCCGGAAVTAETAADSAFGTVVQVDYTGGGTIAGLKYGPGAELLDASAFAAAGTLEFDALVTRIGVGDWKLKIEGATGTDAVEVPFTASLQGLPPVEGAWQHYTFDIANALSAGTLKWNEVKLLLFFSDFGSGLGQIQVDNVGFRAGTGGGGGGGGAGGEIAVNGGLESGLTGWEATPNGGTSELSSAQAHTGTNSARLRADVAANGGGASFPDIKLANAGVGVVTNGQSLTVSFWTKTVEQTGAVPFFAQLFTEQSGGGASKTDFLIQPPTFLTTGDWQQHSFSVTLGPDASAGVSLLFKADCGASPGCVLDVFIDDVSIVAN
jgi:hypothetical protein